MAGFKPGQSPPPVRMPIRFMGCAAISNLSIQALSPSRLVNRFSGSGFLDSGAVPVEWNPCRHLLGRESIADLPWRGMPLNDPGQFSDPLDRLPREKGGALK